MLWENADHAIPNGRAIPRCRSASHLIIGSYAETARAGQSVVPGTSLFNGPALNSDSACPPSIFFLSGGNKSISARSVEPVLAATASLVMEQLLGLPLLDSISVWRVLSTTTVHGSTLALVPSGLPCHIKFSASTAHDSNIHILTQFFKNQSISVQLYIPFHINWPPVSIFCSGHSKAFYTAYSERKADCMLSVPDDGLKSW
jgi:hypothetical protein